MAALRPSRLVLAALLAVAVLGACATAATALPVEFALVSVEFSGDGYAVYHNGVNTTRAAGAFWDDDTMVFNTEQGQLTIDQPDESDSLSGVAVQRVRGLGIAHPCDSQYQLLQNIRPGRTATAAGPRFWTHSDWTPVFGPDPGKDGVLVSAAPYFADFTRTSGRCNDGNGPLIDLNDQFKHYAACVVRRNGVCTATIRVPTHTVTCNAGCDRTYSGVMTMTVHRFDSSPPLDPIPELIKHFVPLELPYLDNLPLVPVGGPYDPPPPVILIPPKRDSGTVDETVYIGKQPVMRLKAKVKAGVRATLRPVVVRSGAMAVQRITAPTQLTSRIVFTPTGKAARRFTVPFFVLPKGKDSTGTGSTRATIDSVSFTGSAASPTVVIHGTNLGTKPAPNPAHHPAGLNGCPALSGDTGYDFGTSLYLAVPSKNWSAGRSRPAVKEVDCLDLVVTRFTSTEVDFHFGPFYKSAYPQFALTPGLPVQVSVNGTTANAIVKY